MLNRVQSELDKLKIFGEILTDSIRFRKIDKLNVNDHYYLEEDDECYYLFEYTPRKGFQYSSGNKLIINLKKDLTKINLPEYKYKIEAMKECSEHIARRFSLDWLKKATLVPVPPSIKKGEQGYDNRILQICKKIPVNFSIDVKEFISQIESIPSSHSSGDDRPSVKELIQNYSFNESIVLDAPSHIGIVDDVLTAGAHFRAMKNILSSKFPDASIVGIFIARRIFPPDNIEFYL